MPSTDNNEMAIVWLAAFGSSYVIYKAVSGYLAVSSTLHTLRGPDSPSWLLGNAHVTRAYRNRTLEDWMREYGSVFAIHSFFGTKALLVSDTKAASFVLNHPNEFPKPKNLVNAARNTFGDGLLTAEGFEHKRQRKVINPAFSVAAMRDITPIVMQVAHELRDVWKQQLSTSTSFSEGIQQQEIDVVSWFSKTALDMIGLAGFGYKFNAIHDSSNELAKAFYDLTKNFSIITLMGLLTTFFPVLRYLPTASNKANNGSMAVMKRVGSQMVSDKKAEAERLGEGSEVPGKDLLSILIRANMKENGAEKLDDETLLGEISTFLLAGHETTATAMSWGLYWLAKAPSLQSKLREEVLAVPNDSPSMDELNSLPYLNNVVKELLRLTPPIPTGRRIAALDTVIPLAQSVIDKNGKEINEIFVRRGEDIMIHTFASNTTPDIWGPDAFEFRPERFDKLPEAVSEVPSMYGNLSTFLAGPKGCIGFRVALLEIKAMLFALIRAFEFDIDPMLEITGKFVIALKPSVKGQEEKGAYLPLRISLYQR
ncbi:hypothetical protein FRB95_003451 [Tulasnella sp. JGI-2019a]|nr:hypothetical protein FRB93_003867 [Tulasnella sp. JGI-2019a]KAG9030888.1 hypothetical protein FRB95_003451 [Tulasnella sp. JGI-2019a]